jgi:hypothetical protein
MLENSSSVVLASLRASTYRSLRLVSSLAAALFGEMRVLARWGGWVRTVAFLNILWVMLIVRWYSLDTAPVPDLTRVPLA